MNTSQIFFGICVSLERDTNKNTGKPFVRLTVTAPNPYRKKGEKELEWFDGPFQLYGHAANYAEKHFVEGHTAAIFVDWVARKNGLYANWTPSVRQVLIYPTENAQNRPRSAPNPRQESTPQSASTTQDDDHPPF